jgi:hypothetical protein
VHESRPGSQPRTRRRFLVAAAIIGAVIAEVAAAYLVVPPVHTFLYGPPAVAAAGDNASALALSSDGRLLYVANGNDTNSHDTVTVLNTVTNQGAGVLHGLQDPGQLVLTPDGRTLFVLVGYADSNSNYWVMPVSLPSGKHGTPIRAAGGAMYLALSPDGRTLYVGTGDDAIVPVSVTTGRRARPIQLPRLASGWTVLNGLAMAPDGKTLYADVTEMPKSGRPADEIVGVNLASGKPGAQIFLTHDVCAMAVAPDSRTLYLAIDGDSGAGDRPGEDRLVAVDVARRGQRGKALSIGRDPLGLAVASDGRWLYVMGPSSVTPVPLIDGVPGAAGSPMRTGGRLQDSGNTALVLMPDRRTLYVAGANGVERVVAR